ncbi:MAG TPA: beta-propeller fold lactonase family protein [Bryobacteraceae bacterium]|nr:beta-propeller fold lactonase family protein [Bryobacteraceae bacterium]
MKQSIMECVSSVRGIFTKPGVVILPVVFGLLGCAGALSAAGKANVLYIENNNQATGQNAVLGYTRNADGSLTDLPGSPFYTNGTGFRNTTEAIGPDDTDGELLLSPDKLFLFAVNEGSNDISVFRVRLDGTLRLVPGSPFPSGGKFPDSLAWSNGYLYVANRGDGVLPVMVTPTYTPGTRGATNYTSFFVNGDGSLVAQPQNTVNAPDGSSPAQVIASADGQFLWALTPFSPTNDPIVVPIFPQAQSRIASFALDEDDGSMNSRGEAYLPSNPLFVINNVNRGGYMLGMRAHPTQNILYANVVLGNVISVWTWDQTGALTFQSGVDPGTVGRAADPCWIAVDPMGRWAYTANVNQNVIQAFSLANPLAPAALQIVSLAGAKANLPAGTPEPYAFTTAPFDLSTDPAGKFLYVSNHGTCTVNSIDATNCPVGNSIHILKINSDGTLTEQPNSPYVFPATVVPTNARPKGMVVL